MEINEKPMVKPDNYLVWAILTTLLCCMPFGIVAIVYAAGVDSAWNNGNYAEAMEKSRSAAKWCKLSALVGGIGIVLYILLIIALVMLNVLAM